MRPSVTRIAASVLALPFVVTIVIPALLLGLSIAEWPVGELNWLAGLGVIVGASHVTAGAALVARCVALFASRGAGTLAPWDPTRRLVVAGPYRHVRNPMISGVMLILLGEVLAFRSMALLVWLAIFLITNLVYIPHWEESRLAERFGEDYLEYRRNVPAWIPRLRPWEPE